MMISFKLTLAILTFQLLYNESTQKLQIEKGTRIKFLKDLQDIYKEYRSIPIKNIHKLSTTKQKLATYKNQLSNREVKEYLPIKVNKTNPVILKRSKRNYVQFAEMIRFITRREPLLFNGYGNYCGWKTGSGPVLDDVDKCCEVHDNCYSKADEGTLCRKFIVYIPFITYKWKKEGNRVTCIDVEPCPKFVCNCDREISECFAKHKYDPLLKKPSILDIFISPFVVTPYD